MAALPLVIIFVPIAGILGIIAVICIISIGLIEGFTVTWMIMLARKKHPAHWFWRPFAWSTITTWLSCLAIILNALMINMLINADHTILAILLPILCSFPFIIGIIILFIISFIQWIRSKNINKKKTSRKFSYTISSKFIIFVGNIFMMVFQLLLVSIISIVVSGSWGEHNVFTIVCIIISIVLVPGSVGLWFAGGKIKGYSLK